MAALPDIEIYLTSGGDEEVQTPVNRVSIRQRGKTIQCHGFGSSAPLAVLPRLLNASLFESGLKLPQLGAS